MRSVTTGLHSFVLPRNMQKAFPLNQGENLAC